MVEKMVSPLEGRKKRKRSSFEQQQLTDRVCERPWARDGEAQGSVDWNRNGWPDAKFEGTRAKWERQRCGSRRAGW